MEHLDKIDNLSLIENGFQHLLFEFNQPKPCFFRVARESPLILYRSMIEVLKGTDNFAVSGRPTKNCIQKYKIGEKSWQEIHKIKIEGCKHAWRFSKPKLCDEPTNDFNNVSGDKKTSNFLISFYDALAMVQTECFMIQFVHSKYPKENLVCLPKFDYKFLMIIYSMEVFDVI